MADITAEISTSEIVAGVEGDTTIEVTVLSGQGPPGDATNGSSMEVSETPTGTVDGSNATFQTLADFVPGQVAVYINGLRQRLTTDFTTTGTRTITLTSSPQVGDAITVDYEKA